MPCCRLLAIVVLGVALAPSGLHAQTKGHVTGVGGIFVKSDHPKALMAWYRDVLGIRIEPWGGAALSYDAPGHPPVLTLNAFARDSDYLAPSKREFMLDFAVDDLDAILLKVQASGVAVLKRDDDDPAEDSPGSSIRTAPRSNCGSRKRKHRPSERIAVRHAPRRRNVGMRPKRTRPPEGGLVRWRKDCAGLNASC